ncbi:hypothetical protein FRC08_017133 [Ceratobasidium sp. 394]|nr:hypothetical protein FRC08_017133 [Ceratobasidium sp. 394]
MSNPASQALEHERTPSSQFDHFLAALRTAPTPPAAQKPPESVDAATWSKRVITATKNTFLTPCHGSEVEQLVAIRQVRACLLSCINELDALASRKSFDVP